MLLLLLGWRALARGQSGMIGVLTRNGLIRSDDNVIAFKLLCRQTTAVVTVVHDRLERSRRAVILDLLLPVRDDGQRDDWIGVIERMIMRIGRV